MIQGGVPGNTQSRGFRAKQALGRGERALPLLPEARGVGPRMNATRMLLEDSGTDGPKSPKEAMGRPLTRPSLAVGLSGDYRHCTDTGGPEVSGAPAPQDGADHSRVKQRILMACRE